MTNASQWLIDSFLSGVLSASDLISNTLMPGDTIETSDDVSNLEVNTQVYLDRVFTAVDQYCSDSELRDDDDLDDGQLLSEITRLNRQWCESV
ncbi:MAG: hypothetical protein CITR_00544 [Citrobacter freundii]